MKLKITLLEKVLTGYYILDFDTKKFRLNWFTDCGEWFIYITLGKKWYRFSSCGFMKGKVEG